MPNRARSFRVVAGLVLLAAVLAAATGCTINVPLLSRADRLETVTIARSDRLIEPNRIALINIDGYIGQYGARGFRSLSTSVADVKQKLEMARNDGSVKAVLLRVHSPGGEVTASDMIYNELMRFRRETGKPVVVYMMGLAASGGYYVSLAGDNLIAHPTCLTGSVGVIMEFMDIEGLMKTFGIRAEAVKSGEMKNMGSPFRGLNPKEKDVLQAINTQMFDRFLGLVEKRRHLKPEAVATIRDGRILTGLQARDLGLVDSVGCMDDALTMAKALARIPSANVIAYRPYRSFNRNTFASYAGEVPQPQAVGDLVRMLAGRSNPGFLYLWQPAE